MFIQMRPLDPNDPGVTVVHVSDGKGEIVAYLPDPSRAEDIVSALNEHETMYHS